MKHNFTRKDLLCKLINDDTEHDYMQSVFDSYQFISVAYEILRQFDLECDDIVNADIDKNNKIIAIRLSDSVIKTIKNELKKDYSVCENEERHVECSIKGKFLTMKFR